MNGDKKCCREVGTRNGGYADKKSGRKLGKKEDTRHGEDKWRQESTTRSLDEKCQ